MNFGYYTFPVLLIGLTATLYGWQEPRIKKLEKGRMKRLKQIVNDLFVSEEVITAKNHVHKFFTDNYVTHKDVLMPIQKLQPYRKVGWCIVGALIAATLAALFEAKLQESNVNVVGFSISANDAITALIIFLCALASRWLYDEFWYMRRIINLFDNHDEEES